MRISDCPAMSSGMIAITTANRSSLLRRVSLGIPEPAGAGRYRGLARIVNVLDAEPQARPEVSLTVNVTGMLPGVGRPGT